MASGGCVVELVALVGGGRSANAVGVLGARASGGVVGAAALSNGGLVGLVGLGVGVLSCSSTTSAKRLPSAPVAEPRNARAKRARLCGGSPMKRSIKLPSVGKLNNRGLCPNGCEHLIAHVTWYGSTVLARQQHKPNPERDPPSR